MRGSCNEEWVFKPGYFGWGPCGMWILMFNFNLTESLKKFNNTKCFFFSFFLAVNMSCTSTCTNKKNRNKTWKNKYYRNTMPSPPDINPSNAFPYKILKKSSDSLRRSRKDRNLLASSKINFILTAFLSSDREFSQFWMRLLSSKMKKVLNSRSFQISSKYYAG